MISKHTIMIISFIISQNNNIPRIRKNIESLCDKYGEPIEGSDRHAFPKPEALASADETDLAAMRLGYRGPYIIAAARKFLECGCPGCREELLSYYGIGPKVANCIMLFGLNRTAAYPVDTWIFKQGKTAELDTPKKVQAFYQARYGSLAGFAQQYIFHYARR